MGKLTLLVTATIINVVVFALVVGLLVPWMVSYPNDVLVLFGAILPIPTIMLQIQMQIAMTKRYIKATKKVKPA